MSDAVEIVEREGVGRMVSLIGSQSTATSPAEDVCVPLFYSIMSFSFMRLFAC